MGVKSCIYGKMRLAVCLPQQPRAQTIHSKWHLFCLHIKSMSQVVCTVHKSFLILKDSECFDCMSSSLPVSVFEGETFESWKYSSYLFSPVLWFKGCLVAPTGTSCSSLSVTPTPMSETMVFYTVLLALRNSDHSSALQGCGVLPKCWNRHHGIWWVCYGDIWAICVLQNASGAKIH